MTGKRLAIVIQLSKRIGHPDPSQLVKIDPRVGKNSRKVAAWRRIKKFETSRAVRKRSESASQHGRARCRQRRHRRTQGGRECCPQRAANVSGHSYNGLLRTRTSCL